MMDPVPKNLEPLLSGKHTPQRAFAYPLERWRRWTGGLEGVGPVLNSLPAELNRPDTARVVEELLPSNVAGAFATAMIWGHGKSGYGPYRTAVVLTGTSSPKGQRLSHEVEERLSLSVEIARADGAVEGYRFLNNRPGKVAGLGPAFFTKWLYFITARGHEYSESAAPILDALVLSWLSKNTSVGLRSGYTDEYERYIDLLKRWGAPYELTPVQVEERIFRLIRNDGMTSQAEA